jgi:ubiquinone biosynthesis protein COQ9
VIARPPPNAERDAAIDALLPIVTEAGWTRAALRRALQEAGGVPDDADRLFPSGAADMVEAYCDLADRRMEAAAAQADLGSLNTGERVRAVISLRLAQNRPHKQAARRAVAILAWPGNAGLAARCSARTVDAIWHAVGDRAADFSWYTKRATLAAIYGATVMFWLRDFSEDDASTLAFLDRRLAGLRRIGRLRRRASSLCRGRSARAA